MTRLDGNAMRLTSGMDQLRFKKLDEAAKLPTQASEGDAGFDLSSIEDVVLHPGDRALVKTGLAVEIPEGFGGLVLPRSGLALRHGITLVNSPGLIDSGYRGEVGVILHNTDAASSFAVEAGDRIAQLMVVPFAQLSPAWADTLSQSERESGGFGSSGTS